LAVGVGAKMAVASSAVRLAVRLADLAAPGAPGTQPLR